MSRAARLEVQRFPSLAGLIDAHGNVSEGFGPAESVMVFEFDPGGSNESLDGGHSDRVITEPRLYAPVDAPFDNADEVEVAGLRFAVDGDPARWRHRNAAHFPGCVVQLRRVDG